jgi:hypothetical protein
MVGTMYFTHVDTQVERKNKSLSVQMYEVSDINPNNTGNARTTIPHITATLNALGDCSVVSWRDSLNNQVTPKTINRMRHQKSG